MSDQTQSHEEHHDPAEPDRPPNAVIVGATVTIVGLIALLILVLTQVYDQLYQQEYAHKVLETPNVDLRTLRVYEAERLTKYQWVDQAQGVVRVPVDRAVELVLADYAGSGKPEEREAK